MILFLDTISPLPEFCIIKDSKIIYSELIIEQNNQKMSDYIIPKYEKIEKKFELNTNLESMIVCNGPGSYTGLRIGIAFMCGLSLSKKIPIKSVSCVQLLNLFSKKYDKNSLAMYVISGNNQKFLCFNQSVNQDYSVDKIDKFSLSLFPNIKDLLVNYETKEIFSPELKINKLDLKNMILMHLDKILKFKDSDIINPIYISNNIILN